MKPLLQVTNAEEQKREMEEEIKKLNTGYEKLRIEYDELAKKNDVVLLDNKMLEDQLREEKFLTQEAEEVHVLYMYMCMYNCNYSIHEFKML